MSLARACRLRAAGDHAAACEVLDGLLRRRPRLLEGLHLRAESRRMLGRFDEALADAERALEASAGHPALLVARAEALRCLGRFAAARADAAAAIAAHPRETWPRVVAAKVEADAGRWAAALRLLARARRLAPREAKVLGWRGEVCRRMGRAADACRALDEAIRLDPRCAWFHGCRAAARAAAGDFLGGLEDFKAAASVNPRCEAFHDMGGAPWLLAWRGEARRSQLGDRPGARADLDAALRSEPDHAWALLSRAVLLGETGDSRGQLRDFARLRRVAPELISGPLDARAFRRAADASRHRVRRLVLDARARLSRRDAAGARSTLERAIAEDPNAAGRFDAELDRLVEAGEVRAALERLDAVQGRFPRDWALAQRGELLRQPAVNRQSEAVRALAAAARLGPERAWIRALLGRARFHGAQRRAGLADLDAAIALAPRCGWLYAWRGEALRQLGDVGGAHRDFTRAVALSPHYAWSYAWRGGVRRALGLLEPAREDLDAFLSVVDGYPWARRERAEVLRRLGDAQGCFADLRRAAAFELDGSILAGGGLSPEERRRAAQAAADFGALGRRRPDLAWARAWKGEALLRLRRYRAALTELDAAVAREPRLDWPRAWRAEALAALGRRDAAAREVEEALRLDERYPRAYALRGSLRRRAGDFEGAASDFGRACGGRSTASWCLALHGEALLKAGRRREAIEQLSKALELDPRHHDARKWLERARQPAKRR